MEGQSVTRGRFTWKIENFSELTAEKLCSEVFTVGGCKWRLLIFPKGSGTNDLSLFLGVADSATLSSGWSRSAKFCLILVNQNRIANSVEKEGQKDFTVRYSEWGFQSFLPLTELDQAKGYLVNDTLVVKAEVCVLSTTPPVITQSDGPTDEFDFYFTGLEEFINTSKTNGVGAGSSLQNDNSVSTSDIPSLEEVEKAKQSLRECLSDLFKLNMRERLAEALCTLSLATTGLSSEQQKAIQTFWANFDDFTSDFLIFEQDNAEFELQKLQKDQMFSVMNKSRDAHILNKKLFDDITKEEEELKKKLEEAKSRKEKLISDWKMVMFESEEAKSGYKALEKKVAEAEEKKRIAEERMSRSTTAWSSLKTLFT